MNDLPDLRPSRVIIDHVRPSVPGGYLAKGSIGAPFRVRADVFTDGHDLVAAALHYRESGAEQWCEIPMTGLGNDRWQAEVQPHELGPFDYRVVGWNDRYASWRNELVKKLGAGQSIESELTEGAIMVGRALDRADSEHDRSTLANAADAYGRGGVDPIGDPEVVSAMWRCADRTPLAMGPELRAFIDPAIARFSSWYELFPRSTVAGGHGHGNLCSVIDRLPYVAGMGFDVLYLPPIHPIGRQGRKGPNNLTSAGPEDVGSPWAIGGEEGGHFSVDPRLGTLDDVRTLADAARDHGIHLALDLAFQCSPDHPWVEQHPAWFKHRPDGSIRYAENPPKRYEDIYPLDFESEDWQGLWREALAVVDHWIDHGVRIFRVDNPHTKPFPFWEWLISSVKARHPDVVMLAEAFSRPRVMEQLAKVGFSQSYTYFTWRQTSTELQSYLTELTEDTVDYLRPNAWPNTPDILTEELQHGGRAASMTRAVLAATLFPNWGVYGPAFELVSVAPRHPGSEEYLDSEKYQLRHWDLDQPQSLSYLLARLNAIRRSHPALQHLSGLHFQPCTNDRLLCYSKRSPDGRDLMLIITNLDPDHPQQGWVDIDWAHLGLPYDQTYVLDDVLGGGTYHWRGSHNWVGLDPNGLAAHVFQVREVHP